MTFTGTKFTVSCPIFYINGQYFFLDKFSDSAAYALAIFYLLGSNESRIRC